MRPLAPLLVVPPLLLVAAFRGGDARAPRPASDPAQVHAPAPTSPTVHVVAARADLTERIELDGRFAPAEADELRLAPAAYSGELTFVAVVPHGTHVNAGDEVARLDPEPLERILAEAERALAAAELAQRGALARGRIAQENGTVAEEEAGLALQRAEDALEAWRAQLELDRRGEELGAQLTRHGIEDQEDELAQLEAMYRDDELIEATEEIVLKRSRRNLARSRTGQQLGADRREHARTHRHPLETARREEAIPRAARVLAQLAVTQELEAAERSLELAQAARALDEARQRVEDLGVDRAALTLRAPRDGIVLHGGWKAWRAGGTRPDHEPGGRAAPRTGLFLVAHPDRLQVVLTAPEEQVATLAAKGLYVAGVTVQPGLGGEPRIGRLELDAYPRADGRFGARVVLDGPLVGIVAGSGAHLVASSTLAEDVLLLPRAAVRGTPDQPWCWAAADGQELYRRVSLRLGRERHGDVVVQAGLEEGARVLLPGE